MAKRLTEEADRLVGRAELFLTKTEDIERRILSASRDDFVRTSTLLIESLNSTSIDLSKILEADVPDDVWHKYLEGDRSIFSRRTLKLATRKTRRIIEQKFESEPEFRDHVLKFCRDFESLMERVMAGDKGGALSVTLISSEMGKLYVLLAQSLKKMT